MRTKQIKKKIIKALSNKKMLKCYCCLLIIPFSSKEKADKPEFKKYARNLLEVDDNFYEEILEDYKDYQNEN